jgi:hypothetical protein
MCARLVGPDELLTDKVYLRFLAALDSDADDAVAQATKLLGQKSIRELSLDSLADYKADILQLKRARAEFERLKTPRTDARKYAAASQKYQLSLQELQQENFYVSAVNDEDLASKSLAIVQTLGRLQLELESRAIYQAFENLRALNAKIQEAINEVLNTVIKRGLNVLLVGVAKALEPEDEILQAITALVELVGHLTVDELLGPSGVTVSSAATEAVGALGGSGTLRLMKGMERETAKAGGDIMGFLAAVKTLIDDSDEVGEAEDKLQELKETYEVARKSVQVMLATMVPLQRKLKELADNLRGGVLAIVRAEKQKADAAENYDKIANMLRGP